MGSFGGLNKRTLSEDSETHSEGYKTCLELYQGQKLEEAAKCIEPIKNQLLHVQAGCELMVSIYAESMNYGELKKICETCISKKVVNDTVVEGLSFALSVEGNANLAIESLKEIEKTYQSSRLYVSLSRLNLMLGKDKEAKTYYLQALRIADVWSMWVTYALKISIFNSDPEFLNSLVDIVIDKDDKNPKVEAKLLEAAKALKQTQLIDKISKYAAHHNSENQSEL